MYFRGERAANLIKEQSASRDIMHLNYENHRGN
jgi:hypothetical protein